MTGENGNIVNQAGSDISVRGLGTFEIAFSEHTVDSWKAGKARNLLQLLLLQSNRAVSRDVIHEALWPDGARGSESSSLKVAVHMLRRILTEAQERYLPAGSTSSMKLLTCDSGYMLEIHDVRTDYDDFDALITRAHSAQHRNDLRQADQLYSRAVKLYQGDFLPNVESDWAATQREWLRSRQLCALEFLSTRRLAQRDHLSVIDLCQRMLATDSLHEPSYRMLVSVHGRMGQLTQAQRWYDLCVKRLSDALQATPDHETQRLYREVVRGGLIPKAQCAADSRLGKTG